MKETDLSHKLMPALNKVGHACRIENVAESSCPDVNYAFVRAQGWLETKVFHGSFLHFEKFQLPWMRARCRATEGRYVWVLATDFRYITLYSGYQLLGCETSIYKKWTRIHRKDLPNPQLTLDWYRPNWAELISVLADE